MAASALRHAELQRPSWANGPSGRVYRFPSLNVPFLDDAT